MFLLAAFHFNTSSVPASHPLRYTRTAMAREKLSTPSATQATPPPQGAARPSSAPASGTRARGRPRGPFTQHRRLDALRSLLQRHPKGLTIYELARELDVTPRSMRRYLGEVKREIDLISSVDKPGGARLWRLAPSEVPRKVEVRRKIGRASCRERVG